MKYVMLVCIVIVCISGCKNEKKINGVICRKYGTDWTPIADICINCNTYVLSKYCDDCGYKAPLVTGRMRCNNCGYMGYPRGDKYCGECGNPTMEMVLITRN